MLSEAILIMFVLGIWLSAIGFCLNQYKSLRRLETQVHYCVNRKDPVNIGEIKIVAHEQDSIIYKKKRYSTAADTHARAAEQTALSPPSGLIVGRDDLATSLPLSATMGFHSALNIALPAHDEAAEYRTAQSSPYTGYLSTAPGPGNESMTFVAPLSKNRHV